MILGLETVMVSGGGSVGVLGGEGEEWRREVGRCGSVAGELVPVVVELLRELGVSGRSLEGIAVDCGPGSFTGIRVGIATALGLGDGWEVPVWGVTHFDLFPEVGEGRRRLVVVEAGFGGGIFYELREGEKIWRGYGVIGERDLDEVFEGGGVYFGTEGSEVLEARGWERGEGVVIDAIEVCRAARRLRARGEGMKVEPLYLHTQAYMKARSGVEGHEAIEGRSGG
ncbi:MAG: tRNA (adenosine(37)-N6)-threonylcarbamoyltransferase complex dimerization subunit type 1 TsaB [bacterium]|nr:tRNA (adenosine(37)-N6)-threonylcarbamoyltransferase complex dimerization subunit type 1 TsaB [bacterium]